MRRVPVIIWGILILATLSACSVLPLPRAESTEPPTQAVIVATATPPEVAAQDAQATPFEVSAPAEAAPGEDRVTLTPTIQPTSPPLMTAWPLEADLYYLNDAGQVWRQPLAGDEDAAASVTRLDLFVYDFAIAPGGDWLLYRTDDYLAIASMDGTSGQLLDNGLGLPLTSPHGCTISWSPDASKIAYTTESGFRLYIPGAGADFAPLVFAAAEEPLVDLSWSRDSEWLLALRESGIATLYRSDPDLSLWVELGAISGYTWLTDGRLAFAPSEGGLALVDPFDLDSRVFLVTQERQVTLPGQQADGTLAFFVHPDGAEAPGFLHLADPRDLSFRQESSIPVQTADFAWTPTATRLLSRDEADPTAITLLDPLTGSRASFEAAGAPATFGWGDVPPQSVAALPLPADLYFLAPHNDVVQLWRLPANGEPPEPLTDAISDVTAYTVSADGKQIAYTSEAVIYQAPVGTLSVSQVIALSDEARDRTGTLAFSPSGQQIAYTDNGTWVIDLEGGEPRRLVADFLPQRAEEERLVQIYRNPQWSPDGDWILVQVSFYEGYDFALISPEGTPRGPILLNLFQPRARWMQNGDLLVYSEGGFYGEPMLNRIIPGAQPQYTPLLALPIVDVQLRSDGRLALLGRLSPAYTTGPTSVRIYSIPLESGAALETDLRTETSAIVLENPVLSPDGVLVAGLLQSQFNELGWLTGQLAIINPATGEAFTITGVSDVFDISWGP